eukprot:scaffold501317_cov21-Prasinocladus_malaysianus.AAC.1
MVQAGMYSQNVVIFILPQNGSKYWYPPRARAEIYIALPSGSTFLRSRDSWSTLRILAPEALFFEVMITLEASLIIMGCLMHYFGLPWSDLQLFKICGIASE